MVNSESSSPSIGWKKKSTLASILAVFGLEDSLVTDALAAGGCFTPHSRAELVTETPTPWNGGTHGPSDSARRERNMAGGAAKEGAAAAKGTAEERRSATSIGDAINRAKIVKNIVVVVWIWLGRVLVCVVVVREGGRVVAVVVAFKSRSPSRPYM